jgi:tetratricopeptide (TPR) repeat protein
MSEESLYTTRDVARVFGIQESRVLYWVRMGVVGPSVRRGGRGFFTFTDLVSVKAAKELIDRGATLQAVRRNLGALRQQLPSMERPLERLRVLSNGDQIAVVADDVAFEPMSGQLVMDFMVRNLETRVAEVMQLAPREETPAPTPKTAVAEDLSTRSAYGWFTRGCNLDEEGQAEAAVEAFHHALALDPSLAAAHTNLGNIAHRDGRRGDAREYYEKALALDPEQPEARYNLANVLDEIGESQLAIAEWTRVAAICPGFADAHFNLGAALARQGAGPAAGVHLARYLELDGDGEWAATARRLLADLAASRRSPSV